MKINQIIWKCAAKTGAMAIASAVAGCGSLQSEPEGLISAAPEGPVVLAPKRAADSGPAPIAYAGSIDPAELGKAIERFRVTKKREASPYETGAADLNGDGKPEAVVLFTGQDWCLKTGCSLVVFQSQEFGFRPVSHIVNVRPAVLAAPSQGSGWRDLIVKTGGGGAPVRAVTVSFSSNGYAANAIVLPMADAAVASSAASIIQDTPSFQSALDQHAANIAEPGQEPVRQTGLSHFSDQTRNP